MTNEQLLSEAKEQLKFAHTPFCNFKVGSAILTKSGRVFVGSNVQTLIGMNMCAERVALFSAISAGEKEFDKIAIVSEKNELCFPCGVCRQFLMEFAPELTVVLLNSDGIKEFKLKDLLPNSFEK